MQTEDLVDLPASSNSASKSDNGGLHKYNCEPSDTGSQPSKSEVKEDKPNGKISGTGEVDVGNVDVQLLLAAEMDSDLIGRSSVLKVVTEDVNIFSSTIQTENDCLNTQDGSSINNQKRVGSPVSNSITGVKKARITVDEQQPSVHVIYKSLTSDSKRKLEEVLQLWSEWHAQHCSSSQDSNNVLESGEETYFPALRVGLDNSAVFFWMDDQSKSQKNKEFIPLDGKNVPLYDRGYSSGLTSTDGSSNLERGLGADASRCFNCGSYNHSFKECPKPRDNAAVNNARKQRNSKRNHNASSRIPTRYYQNTPGGKYDGLRPGVLDAETRQLLGLGELDPPPWLNRMREIGYPPGYLDPEDEDQPSGIIIFADEEIKEEKGDGEILETECPEPPRKMSVEFPGINAPIPENADERRWAARLSSSNSSRNRSNRRSNYPMEPNSRGPYHEQQRLPWDIKDEGPPGCDPGFNSTLSSFSPRYGAYDSSDGSHSGRGNILLPSSPSVGRSLSDRGRWGPLVHDGSPNAGPYNYVPYSPWFSPQNYGSSGYEKRDDDCR